MEATERRLGSAVRMPVDLLVQLAHDGEHECFDADAVNLSATGLGLRSSVLPDIGQRLRCRFEVPDDGSVCETTAEVVWASDAGAHTGEFGVKFDTLEPRVREVLDSWVTTLEGNPPRVITPVSTMAPDLRSGRVAGRAVRVQIDGVAHAIEGTIRSDRGQTVAIEQPLPFLAIGRAATLEVGEREERRMLANVELVVDGDVPRLVLILAKMPARSTTRSAPPDMRAPEPSLRSSEATMQDDSLAALEEARAEEEESVAVRASSAGSEWVTGDVETPSSLDTGALPLAADEPLAVFDERGGEDSAEAPVRASRDLGRMREREPARAMKLDADASEAPESRMLAARERWRAISERVSPGLASVVAKMRAAWAITVATTGPWASRAIAWIAKTARAIAEQVRARAPERLSGLLGKAPKRRTTAAPPAPAPAPRKLRTTGTEAAAPSEVVSPMRGKGRLVLAGIVAVAAVGLTAYALGGSSEPVEAPIEVPDAVAASVETSTPVVDVPEAVAPATASTPIPMPIPDPEPAGGHLPPPTFPSLGTASSATAAEPPAEPVAAAPTESGSDTEFGAASIEGGRTSTLHMSMPVTSLVGQADESGFTVTIHGALSLDRAGPIAAANPSVERASIINRGDHSVLTVRFVAGRNPLYRVAVHGQTVEVTIGR